jgi:hypothetical protein
MSSKARGRAQRSNPVRTDGPIDQAAILKEVRVRLHEELDTARTTLRIFTNAMNADPIGALRGSESAFAAAATTQVIGDVLSRLAKGENVSVAVP